MLADSENLLLLGMPDPQVAVLTNGDAEPRVFDRTAIVEDAVRVEVVAGRVRAIRQVSGPVAIFKRDGDLPARASADQRRLSDAEYFDLGPEPADGDEVIFANMDADRQCYVHLRDDVRVEVGPGQAAGFRAMENHWFGKAA